MHEAAYQGRQLTLCVRGACSLVGFAEQAGFFKLPAIGCRHKSQVGQLADLLSAAQHLLQSPSFRLQGCMAPPLQHRGPHLFWCTITGAGLSLLTRCVTRLTQGPEPAPRTHFALKCWAFF